MYEQDPEPEVQQEGEHVEASVDESAEHQVQEPAIPEHTEEAEPAVEDLDQE